MNTFLPKAVIGELHGTVQEFSDWPYTIIPLYHPAAAIYNGNLRETLFADFQTLKNFLDK